MSIKSSHLKVQQGSKTSLEQHQAGAGLEDQPRAHEFTKTSAFEMRRDISSPCYHSGATTPQTRYQNHPNNNTQPCTPDKD